MSDELPVLILCRDLLFGSALHAAVKRAGRVSRTCLSQASCLEQLQNTTGRWVVADVEMPELDLRTLRTALGVVGKLIAFGPHVRTELLGEAEAAGCDAVYVRGQAAGALQELLCRN